MGTQKPRQGKKHNSDCEKNHGREPPPHAPPPSTPAYDPQPAETATACTTGAAKATGGGRASAAPTPGPRPRPATTPGGTAAGLEKKIKNTQGVGRHAKWTRL